MKTTPIKSYLDLNRILQYYFEWLKNKKQDYSSEVIKLLKTDETIVLLGLIWLNKDIEDISQFQANRYFMEAMNVYSLPTLEMFDGFSIKNDLKNLSFKPKQDLGINNYENIKILAIEILKSFNADNDKTKLLSKQWGPDQKNYFLEHGYVVIPDVMTSSECNDYRKIALKIAHDEKIAKQGFFYGYENKFQRVYNLVNKSLDLGRLLTRPIVTQIMNDLFDRNTFHEKYILSSYHLNIVPPKGEEQKFHIDATVPDSLPSWLIRANMSFIVEDHNENNGALLCLPGSHKFLRKPGLADEHMYKNKLIKIIAPKRSLVIWSGHLWHKTSKNKTADERTALLACFAASHLIEVAMEENHALIVDSENSKYFSDDLKRLLMFSHGIKQGAIMKSKHFKSEKNDKKGNFKKKI